MSRVVRSPWLVVVILACLLGGPLWYASCMRMNTSLAASPPTVPTQQHPPGPFAVELQDAMLLAGFDVKALTAVGVSANLLPSFIAAFRDTYASQAATLDQADAAFSTARVTSDALRRTIESGKGTQEDVTAYQVQVHVMDTVKAARDAALAAARAPAEALLSQTQRGQLARIRTNRTWELPMEFLLVDRTEVQWVALRGALANEKIAPRYGEETAPAHASVLSSARSNSDVALAKSRLDTNLAAMQSAINAAIVQ